jgi:serine/threonine protein kinase
MAQGLNHIFSNKIVHRDLKTANILLKDGKVKIADFGFCEFAHDTLGKQFPYNVGSPLYMSPEAYNRSFYSPKSDIWALGIILCEMLIGAKPFDGMNY